MKRVIESVFKSQDKDTQKKARKMVDVDEETETDEELIATVLKSITRYVSGKVKDKKRQKIVTPQSAKKNTKKAR